MRLKCVCRWVGSSYCEWRMSSLSPCCAVVIDLKPDTGHRNVCVRERWVEGYWNLNSFNKWKYTQAFLEISHTETNLNTVTSVMIKKNSNTHTQTWDASLEPFGFFKDNVEIFSLLIFLHVNDAHLQCLTVDTHPHKEQRTNNHFLLVLPLKY